MEDKKRKIIKEIFIYRDSHLPQDGWIQKCFNCDTLTAKSILFKTLTQNKGCYVKYWEFNVHLCYHCKKYLYANKSENIKKFLTFSKKCNTYIKSEYPLLDKDINYEKEEEEEIEDIVL